MSRRNRQNDRQTCRIPGKSRIDPMIGRRRRKLIAIGTKPLEKKTKFVSFDSINELFDLPKKKKKSVEFNDHPDERPADENEKNSTKEKCCALHFVFLKEESKCSF